jgi:uncharacterized protein YjbJ (UPF0337 family)
VRQAAPPGRFGSFLPIYVAARNRASPAASGEEGLSAWTRTPSRRRGAARCRSASSEPRWLDDKRSSDLVPSGGRDPRIVAAGLWRPPLEQNSQAHRSRFERKEAAMDWNRVEGNWKQVKGTVKQQWGKLTDDDLTQINGSQEKLEGIIQERYGIARDETRKQIDSWYKNQNWQ